MYLLQRSMMLNEFSLLKLVPLVTRTHRSYPKYFLLLSEATESIKCLLLDACITIALRLYHLCSCQRISESAYRIEFVLALYVVLDEHDVVQSLFQLEGIFLPWRYIAQ